MAYFEICNNLREQGGNGWTKHEDDGGNAYAVNGDQWVGYDDRENVAAKVTRTLLPNSNFYLKPPPPFFQMDYVKSHGFGGAMVWAVDLDDFNNVCGGGKYPLLATINRKLRRE